MNTKKALWISRPESLKTTLHSFSFNSEKAHSVFFTIGEDGEITLKKDATAKTAFVLMHTPDEYIVFGDKRIVITFGGTRTSLPFTPVSSVKLTKTGKTLVFTADDREILSIEKDAFLTSASFGLAAKGKGEVILEVF